MFYFPVFYLNIYRWSYKIEGNFANKIPPYISKVQYMGDDELTNEQLTQLVQQLVKDVEFLKVQLKQQQQQNNSKQKGVPKKMPNGIFDSTTEKKKYKTLLNHADYLNDTKNKPIRTFHDWLNAPYILEKYDFEYVQNSDYKTSIERVMRKRLREADIPIVAFEDSPFDVYIYCDRWKLIDMDEIKKIMFKFDNYFSESYFQWLDENKSRMKKSDYKDLNFVYAEKLDISKMIDDKKLMKTREFMYKILMCQM